MDRVKNKMIVRALLVNAGAAVLVMGGCAGKKANLASANKAEAISQRGPVNNGLESLVADAGKGDAGTSLEDLIAQQSADLETMMAGADDGATGSARAVEGASDSRPSELTDWEGTASPIQMASASDRVKQAEAEKNPDPLADAWASEAADVEPIATVASAGGGVGDEGATGLDTGLDTGLASMVGSRPTAAANEALPGAELSPDLMPEIATVPADTGEMDAFADQTIVNEGAGNEPLEQKIDEATIGYMDLLRQQAMASPDPLRPYLVLSILEALKPGATPKVYAADGGEGVPLTEAEQKAVDALREVVTGVVNGDKQSGGGEPALLADLAARLAEDQPLTLRSVELCTQVRGYGQYATVPSGTFKAGQASKVIVYAEVEGFRTRDVKPSDLGVGGEGPDDGDTLAVELVQEVALYHDADGLRVWSTPESKIIETSRTRKRDFYTVHTVTLPANLSVGSYKLKLVVRDVTSGQVTDLNVPVKIVAE